MRSTDLRKNDQCFNGYEKIVRSIRRARKDSKWVKNSPEIEKLRTSSDRIKNGSFQTLSTLWSTQLREAITGFQGGSLEDDDLYL